MNILLDSYNTVFQHVSGGIPMRINKMLQYLNNRTDVKAKCFDKWNDKIADYDVLHVFKANIENLAEMCYAKSLGKRVVLSSVVPQDHANKIKFSLALNKIIPISNTYSFMKQALCVADAIVAQTNQESEFITKTYGISNSKIYVIPNGVNEILLKQNIDERSKQNVICVGRFDSNKNQLSVIKALKNSNIPLHFIGGESIAESDYYKVCRDEAKNSPNIFFHGWVPNSSEQFFEFYRTAKVVILPSYKEIFGNSLIEGAACGANLVATTALPTHEWGLGNHCISVDANNVGSIKKGIIKAFEMPLDPGLRRIIEQKFSWDQVVNRYCQVYCSSI